MDTVVIRGLFTREANMDAEKMLYGKKNIIDSAGRNVRLTEKEAVLTLFELTKNPIF